MSDWTWEYVPIDLGGIKTARGQENYIVLFFETIGVPRTPLFNIHITR